MPTIELPWPLGAEPSMPTGRSNWISERDLRSWAEPAALIDESLYNSAVLRLPPTSSEDELDDRLALEAQSLGLFPLGQISDVDDLASSVSRITVASDSLPRSSTQSQSTAPTSCASSEDRPATQSSHASERSPSTCESPSLHADGDKKRASPLRRGFQKVAGFRKRRSTALGSSTTLASISSDTGTSNSEDASVDVQSPGSIKSRKSSWSKAPSVTKFTSEQPSLVDVEALKRSMDCEELTNLQAAQRDERSRFLAFQTSALAQLRSQRDTLKAQKKEAHDNCLNEQVIKNDRAVEELEARQLEEEMKMEKEHDLEKRTIMLRLRHMEAYCHNPTPPETPMDLASGRPSIDSTLPERKVTDKDYHNLAQQYRERDVMDTLHASKINVLRGKQKKAVERLMSKKERELEGLEREQKNELATIDREFTTHEASLRLALGTRRVRLENRWRTQASIEAAKLEKSTGLKFAPLPDVFAMENSMAPIAAM